MEYNEGESPIDFLQDAALCYATAIKNKPKDANLHQLLGQVLEEKYYAEDLFGLKKEVCFQQIFSELVWGKVWEAVSIVTLDIKVPINSTSTRK